MRSASSHNASAELVRRHGLEVVRAIEPGGTIERSTRALDELEVLVRRDVAPSPERACARTDARSRCGPARSFADPTWYHRFTATIGRGVVLGERDKQSVRQSKSVDRYLHSRKLSFSQYSEEPRPVPCAPMNTLLLTLAIIVIGALAARRRTGRRRVVAPGAHCVPAACRIAARLPPV